MIIYLHLLVNISFYETTTNIEKTQKSKRFSLILVTIINDRKLINTTNNEYNINIIKSASNDSKQIIRIIIIIIILLNTVTDPNPKLHQLK